jgi:DNA repair exonuclease SbcCD ATPase subunit
LSASALVTEECLLRVKADNSLVPSDTNTIIDLIDSAIKKDAYNELIQKDKYKELRQRSENEESFLKGLAVYYERLRSKRGANYSLSVFGVAEDESSSLDPIEQAMLEDLVMTIPLKLEAFFQQLHEDAARELEAEIIRARDDADQAERELRALQQARRDLCAGVDVADLDRQHIVELINDIEQQFWQLKIEHEVSEAVEQAVVERIAELQHELGQHRKPELEKLQVELEQVTRDLERTSEQRRDMTGPVEEAAEDSDHETEEVIGRREHPRLARELDKKINLLESRRELMEIELRELRQHVQEPVSDRIRHHRSKLDDLNIERVRIRKMLDELHERKTFLKEALPRADEYEISIAVQLPLAKDRYEDSIRELEELTRRHQNLEPPEIDILSPGKAPAREIPEQARDRDATEDVAKSQTDGSKDQPSDMK